MKKSIMVATILTLITIAGTAAVFAQPINKQTDLSPNKNDLISASDYESMSDIIIKVNKGELPVSALKDAEQLLNKQGLEQLSHTVRLEYLQSR